MKNIKAQLIACQKTVKDLEEDITLVKSAAARRVIRAEIGWIKDQIEYLKTQQ